MSTVSISLQVTELLAFLREGQPLSGLVQGVFRVENGICCTQMPSTLLLPKSGGLILRHISMPLSQQSPVPKCCSDEPFV